MACLAIPLAAAPLQPAFSQAAEKVTVRFTWKLKGEYAPLFVALNKGYYKAEGLDVDLAEGSGAQTVLKLLAFQEQIHVYVTCGELKTDHSFYLAGQRLLTRRYEIERLSAVSE